MSVSQPSGKFDRFAFFVVWPTFLEGADILHQKQETFKMFRWFSQMFHFGYIKTMMFFLRFFWRFGRNSEHGLPPDFEHFFKKSDGNFGGQFEQWDSFTGPFRGSQG